MRALPRFCPFSLPFPSLFSACMQRRSEDFGLGVLLSAVRLSWRRWWGRRAAAPFAETLTLPLRCRSTIEHPSCNVALSLAQSCCRDGHGQPWPPVPRSVDIADLPITHLSPQDVPSVKDLGMVRGAKLRPGYPPPFSKEWQPTVAVCALRRDSTSDAALLEWLEHHRCVTTPTV